jgi:APA family basic amino acid/polyamine antiporter
MANRLLHWPWSASDKTQLSRSLGALFGIAVSVGSMIGVGVLRTPGIILGHVGEPRLALLIWLAGAAYVLLCINYMAELASAIPRSGGVYAFAERALGHVGGTMVGWSDFLNSVFAIALLAVALAEYIAQLIPGATLRVAWVAALLISVFALLNLSGVRLASGAQQITSSVKLVVLWAFTVACLLFAHPKGSFSSHPAAISPVALSLAGITAAFQLVLGAFNGWAAPAYFGGETKDARHGVARSLLYGALLVSATYLAINAAIMNIVPTSALIASKLPAADALERLSSADGLGVGIGATLFLAVAVLSLPSTLQAVMMQTSRTLHAMSIDGLFPRWGALLNGRGSPANATLVCAALALVLATSSTFETLFVTFTVFAVLNNLILLCGVVRLRHTEPDLPRPFKVIWYPWSLIPIVIVDLIVFVSFAIVHWSQCLLAAVLVLGTYTAHRVRARLFGRDIRLDQRRGE